MKRAELLITLLGLFDACWSTNRRTRLARIILRLEKDIYRVRQAV
jgi:hypothetical protein